MNESEDGACWEGHKPSHSRDEHEEGDELVKVRVERAGLLRELCHPKLVEGVLDDVCDQGHKGDHRHRRGANVHNKESVQNLQELFRNVKLRLYKNN